MLSIAAGISPPPSRTSDHGRVRGAVMGCACLGIGVKITDMKQFVVSLAETIDKKHHNYK